MSLALSLWSLGAAEDDFSQRVGAADDGSGVMALAMQVVDGISDPARVVDAGAFAVSADRLGLLTERAREIPVKSGALLGLLDGAATMRALARDKLRALEEAAGEDEARLEALYRSSAWDDIGYSLAALDYWMAWLNLTLAESGPDAPDFEARLGVAERSFGLGAVKILYPGIVYGSWLGLGYVALARDRLDEAEDRFGRLTRALESDPDNPLGRGAQTELELIRVRKGDITVPPPEEAPLTAAQARLLEEEAFVLLERYRETTVGVADAALRLKRLLYSPYSSDRLLQRLLSYRDDIVGQDLGVYGLLVDAEFAYAYENYYTAVQKYSAFFARSGDDLSFDTAPFLTRFGAAELESGLLREARARIEGLLGLPNLDARLHRILLELRYLVLARQYEQEPTEEMGALLGQAARAFIRAATESPDDYDDSDLPGAELTLARLAGEEDEARRHLEAARDRGASRKDVAAVRLKWLTRRLLAAQEAGDPEEVQAAAGAVLKGIAALSAAQRRETSARALRVQVRTIAGDDPDAVLEELEALEQAPDLDRESARALAWSGLQLLDRLGDRERLLEALRAGLSAGNGERKADAYAFLLDRQESLDSSGDWLALAELLLEIVPALAADGRMQRELWLMAVRGLLRAGDEDRAFTEARRLVAAYPGSGDAWQAYAQVARAASDPVSAERAWARITGGVPEGSPRWMRGIRERILLSVDLGERGKACRLVAQLAAHARGEEDGGLETLPEDLRQECGI